MYRILTASADTYITNKIIDNSFRAKDANVGQAGTLDLFKLYNESSISGEDTPFEKSRILIRFDLDPLTEMKNKGTIDINHSSFSATLKLYDIYGGQTTPSDFKIIAFPLSKSFDEGNGFDVVKFNDVGIGNFITASYTNAVVSGWNLEGAMASGSLGNENIDVIVSGTLAGPTGNQTISLSPYQHFTSGEEDLSLDVTKIVSGTVSGLIPDFGFLLGFSGSYEKDSKTYFIKRFASRHSSREDLRPKIVLKYDDSVIDNHRNFIFDISGSLFLNNYHRGTLSNILSGASATEVKGDDSILLTLKSGSFVKYVTGSQHKVGGVAQAGVYSASFAISQYENSAIYSEAKSAASASFTEIWGSFDGTVGYHTGTLVIETPFRTAFNGSQKRLLLTMINLESVYRKSDVVKLRIFIEDRDKEIVFKKKPYENKSQVYENMFYQVRDIRSNRVIIPFDSVSNSTKMSSDSEGMYFNFHMSSLETGRMYTFEFLVRDFSTDYFIKDVAAKFTINDI
ncbi:MAG TPA: hypothetical protein DF712_07150 [Balneola sp.]|nr:hypothetical protein [Balneola sp.]